MTQSDDYLHFETYVQLKSIIGKDLINNDNIAVLELVKNSYDAGSPRGELVPGKKCSVRYPNSL